MNDLDVRTFGDVRRVLVQNILDMRKGTMTAATGMAIAATAKVLNDSVQVEINAAKMALATEDKVHNFGKVFTMGKLLIGNDSGQETT